MEIEYSLKITELVCDATSNGETNVISCVRWVYSGTDGRNSAAYGGYTNINHTDDEPFTPFSNLTEEQVVTWVLSSMNEARLLEIQTELRRQIENATARVPW